ncbi:MAG: polyprenyl synthetase family protein [Saprospiraceae bacterium]|nr:polyprenyl synthetase family protein [Saprospiraceae bacterium]MBK9728033.1 polyprenyl synthetase family protein [Saprospiraceae bacterium]
MANVRSIEELLKSFQDFMSYISWNKVPTELYQPVDYMMSLGGKRIRPLALIFVSEILEGNKQAALKAAYGLELFHNFTLVHDDIMDHADIRRTKPTVHKKFGVNEAILSGDVMLIESLSFIKEAESQIGSNYLMKLFLKTAREVCEGQSMDMAFENKQIIQMQDYLEMIRLKTAVLLACSFQMSAYIANRSELALALYEVGICVGQAFQLEDDWLDYYSEHEDFGKVKGGDLLRGKKSGLILELLEAMDTSEKKDFLKWYPSESQNDNFMDRIHLVFNEFEVKDMLRARIEAFKQKAFTKIQTMKLSKEQSTLLTEFVNGILNRSF